ncbi:hypothetical protein DF286_00605 [Sphingosinicella humi]|uniref:Lipoprotein n=1 Tax=Allosphingosinicella humi TaxID=2068657 RepID=A0A2U2IZL0_9SPHN|nr:hypothetical protein DF286_00605 [Sphingosinicella humi]
MIYSLSGAVTVGVDVGGDGNAPGGQQGILTIEPGVVLFGSSGADFLLVNRGSQLFAEGTATQPIIFTSRQNVEGTAGADSIGQWGGLVVLGRAPISDCIGNVPGGSVGCQGAVEGTSGDAFYGGASPNDNSGRIRYVQVRYPGFEVSPGNELNGITLAGVGAGTTIDHVQVHNSSDDGIEWFGGTVNQKYIVVTGADDDSIDTDTGFKGAIQFALVVQRSTGGDRIIEGDSSGNENATPRQDTAIANATFVSGGAADNPDSLLLRGGMDFTLLNSVVTGAPICLDIDGNATVQAADAALDEKGPPRFESVFLSCADPFRDDTSVTAAQIAAIFGAGTNNVSDGTSTLTSVFINGANENAVTAFQASSVRSFFEDVDYIGAVRDQNDTWWQGWTCGLGTNSPSCTAAPVPSTGA